MESNFFLNQIFSPCSKSNHLLNAFLLSLCNRCKKPEVWDFKVTFSFLLQRKGTSSVVRGYFDASGSEPSSAGRPRNSELPGESAVWETSFPHVSWERRHFYSMNKYKVISPLCRCTTSCLSSSPKNWICSPDVTFCINKFCPFHYRSLHLDSCLSFQHLRVYLTYISTFHLV